MFAIGRGSLCVSRAACVPMNVMVEPSTHSQTEQQKIWAKQWEEYYARMGQQPPQQQ